MGVLGDIKNRLGGGRRGADDGYADDYDDYNDYNDDGYGAEAGYDYGYDDGYSQDANYADNADYGYESAGTNEAASSAFSSRSTRSGSSYAPLVSNSDVRSTSAIADRYSEQPTQRGGGSYSATHFDDAESRDRHNLAAKNGNRSLQSLADARSELESLKADAGIDSSTLSPESQQTLRSQTRVYRTNPYSGENVARRITTIVPSSYEDVVKVADGYKSAGFVVLSLANVDAALAKRLLDFSFGVASALDGTVSKLNARTFLIARGDITLSQAELDELKKEGIL